jgi:hypothetical protein
MLENFRELWAFIARMVQISVFNWLGSGGRGDVFSALFLNVK